MKREWKPGDVAVVPFASGRVRAMWVKGKGWVVADGSRSNSKHYSVDPLVVIDPEDREAVERLASEFLTHATAQRATVEAVANTMQAALREFANPKPSKPEEPTGLGAVVEDESLVEYIHLGSGLWAYGTTDGPSKGFAYADFNAVRVLSEGVQ